MKCVISALRASPNRKSKTINGYSHSKLSLLIEPVLNVMFVGELTNQWFAYHLLCIFSWVRRKMTNITYRENISLGYKSRLKPWNKRLLIQVNMHCAKTLNETIKAAIKKVNQSFSKIRYLITSQRRCVCSQRWAMKCHLHRDKPMLSVLWSHRDKLKSVCRVCVYWCVCVCLSLCMQVCAHVCRLWVSYVMLAVSEVSPGLTWVINFSPDSHCFCLTISRGWEIQPCVCWKCWDVNKYIVSGRMWAYKNSVHSPLKMALMA